MTVLSQASLTTVPWRMRLGMGCPLAAALAENGLDAGDVAPRLTHPRGVLQLAAGAPETQVEDLLAEGGEFLVELVGGAGPHVGGCHPLHGCAPSPCRVTKRVPIGNLAAASSKASRATAASTPSNSNMMRPGLTRATQNSGEPLPLPIRTSAGLEDTGTSGKMRIHTRPTRRIERVIVRRAASIWRAVMRPGSTAFRPKAPKLSVVPPLASPWMRPLWALRYLLRFGASIFPSL